MSKISMDVGVGVRSTSALSALDCDAGIEVVGVFRLDRRRQEQTLDKEMM